ncbi:MAG: hypothetical protein ACLGIJ_12475, partial [Candidatus Limnocylindria bacterium]
MLTQRAPIRSHFTSLDARRLGIASVILVLVLTAILGSDVLPGDSLEYEAGDVARADIVAPRAITFDSQVLTDQARTQARATVDLRYDFSSDKAFAIAAEQAAAFEARVQRVDTAFRLSLTEADRQALLEAAVTDLPADPRATLVALEPDRWTVVRAEAARVLDETLRSELRDTDVAAERTRLAGRMAGGLTESERMLAASLISPLVVANSSFSEALTEQARDDAAAAVPPVEVSVAQGEVIARSGDRLTAAHVETISELGLGEPTVDTASFAGWFLLAVLAVSMLLAWLWRYRPALWHRDNVLVLISL